MSAGGHDVISMEDENWICILYDRFWMFYPLNFFFIKILQLDIMDVMFWWYKLRIIGFSINDSSNKKNIKISSMKGALHFSETELNWFVRSDWKKFWLNKWNNNKTWIKISFLHFHNHDNYIEDFLCSSKFYLNALYINTWSASSF